MTKNELIWLSGFVDGEGYLTLYPRKRGRKGKREGFTKLISITNTHKPTMIKIAKLLNLKLIYRKSNNPNHRDSWMIRFHSKKVDYFLIKAIPYLITKKEQAKLLLHVSLYGMGTTSEQRKEQRRISDKLKYLHHND
uniref:Putative homing endonuclease n=1 Tax=viral metagenome TaxID=1070528 RepID=A0A6M3L894_9ZZZZ